MNVLKVIMINCGEIKDTPIFLQLEAKSASFQ